MSNHWLKVCPWLWIFCPLPSVTFDFDLVSFVETPGVLPLGNFQVSGWMAICDRLL